MRDKIEQYLAQFHEGDSAPRFHLENFAMWLDAQPKPEPVAYRIDYEKTLGLSTRDRFFGADDKGRMDGKLYSCDYAGLLYNVVPLYAEPVDQSARIAELERKLAESEKQRDAYNAAITAASRTARLMITDQGHEVICIEPQLWVEITNTPTQQSRP